MTDSVMERPTSSTWSAVHQSGLASRPVQQQAVRQELSEYAAAFRAEQGAVTQTEQRCDAVYASGTVEVQRKPLTAQVAGVSRL